MALHRFRKHGIKNVWRSYVNITHCLVCLKEFGSRERVINHVRFKSKVCQNQLYLRGPLLSEDEASNLDQADATLNVKLYSKGQRRHHVSSPVVRLPGPLLPILLEDGSESPHHPLGKGHNYYV